MSGLLICADKKKYDRVVAGGVCFRLCGRGASVSVDWEEQGSALCTCSTVKFT
jgi:hypothetical protein